MQIKVSQATIRFKEKVLVERFDAYFPSNTVTALVGPSGSGKSTLLAAMAGYQSITAGNITFIDDEGIATPPNPDLVAWVPQGSNSLGTRTALDNVAIAPLSEGLSLRESRRIAAHHLELVGLSDHQYRLARSLSGGELQRVSFARALASTKPLIFADEPSASLDARNTEMLAELLLRLESHATIIVATHDPTLVQSARGIVEMRKEPAHAA
jgi:putative ABC transport system ATP-binding protein